MPINISVKEFDELTRSFMNVCCCTYLLRLLDERPNEEYPNYPRYIDACSRSFLHEAQEIELQIMQQIFDRTMCPKESK